MDIRTLVLTKVEHAPMLSELHYLSDEQPSKFQRIIPRNVLPSQGNNRYNTQK